MHRHGRFVPVTPCLKVKFSEQLVPDKQDLTVYKYKILNGFLLTTSAGVSLLYFLLAERFQIGYENLH